MRDARLTRGLAWFMILEGIVIMLIPYTGILGEQDLVSMETIIENWGSFALGFVISIAGVMLYPFRGDE